MRHMKQKTIAVLFGGRSPEYEVSPGLCGRRAGTHGPAAVPFP